MDLDYDQGCEPADDTSLPGWTSCVSCHHWSRAHHSVTKVCEMSGCGCLQFEPVA